MIRMPLATASLLAIAISLAGCGDKDKEKTAATPTPAAATSTATPATDITAAKVDEAAAKAVVFVRYGGDIRQRGYIIHCLFSFVFFDI